MVNFYDISYLNKESMEDIAFIEDVLEEFRSLDVIFYLEGTTGKIKDTVNKAVDKLKKIIETIRNAIKGLIKNIDEKIKYEIKSKETQRKIHEAEEFLKDNPDIRSRKVEDILDWKALQEEFNTADKELEKAYKADTSSEEFTNGATKILNGLNAAISDNKYAVAFSMDTCIAAAKQSPYIAQLISNKLANDDKILANIERQLGYETMADFDKRIEKLTRESIFRRFKLAISSKLQKSYFGCIKGYISAIDKFVKNPLNPVNDAKMALFSHRYTTNVVRQDTKREKELTKALSESTNISVDLNTHVATGVGLIDKKKPIRYKK